MTGSDAAATAPAYTEGRVHADLPPDLYIPPDAMEVYLATFEGPLDLLLYLIRRQNLDILDIPIHSVTRQYMDYLAAMQARRFELAAEYLVMAAVLAEIKSRMLLPRPAPLETDEADPRAELVRRLLEYERFKRATEALDALPRMDRDHLQASAEPPRAERRPIPPAVSLDELLEALQEALHRAELSGHHHVQREALSVPDRMAHLVQALSAGELRPFSTLFPAMEGRLGVVVTFLAVLELIREAVLEVVQAEPFAPLYVRLRG